MPAAPPHERNVVRAVEDGGERVTVGRKLGAAETSEGALALLVDPGDCTRAVDLFEPEIR